MIVLKSDREIAYMQDAGKIVAETLEELRKAVAPNVSTKDLDIIAEDYITSKGAVPAFKGYCGFPATICASINEQVVHGIPGLRSLELGDIISIDCGAVINGYYGDAAKTFAVGDISEEVSSLLNVTEESLYKGIEEAKIGNRLSDISNSIQSYVEYNGFSIVRDFVGHGIGSRMHEEPQVPNFGNPGHGPRLKAGMCLAIEPMVNIGTYEVEVLEDNWTVVTKDHKFSAHFEHSIAITEKGPLILTKL
ncbi:methionine aminopeptidase, type I [Desulfonispora thiosulfatigenes DSM 11270]|uniref:Methionine aminopeptidase n=1 Tax=Desulfonispora thiosulfatigenes DSM 11270 TaxID=656914 RepID=A0A1W1URL7_DESTI|nr:type I methionyl aminopeptidase [Desulfonispora thiosulfatigenes]SMB83752.1 methionine aminopeptidase, type I [Desulfonispora thiosulfatigenes DSM 11270]